MTYILQKVNIKRKIDVGKNLQINLCNLLFFVVFIMLGLGHFISLFLGAFKVF